MTKKILSDEQAIKDLVKKWMDATKTGDIETVLSLMTDDAIFLVPGEQPFGKDIFRKAAENMKPGEKSGVQFEGSSDIEELKIFGDWAYARARLKVSTTLSDVDEPIHRSGYTLTIFQKEDGEWRLARDANLLTVEKTINP